MISYARIFSAPLTSNHTHAIVGDWKNKLGPFFCEFFLSNSHRKDVTNRRSVLCDYACVGNMDLQKQDRHSHLQEFIV